MMGGSQSVTPEVEVEAPGGVGPLEANVAPTSTQVPATEGPVAGDQQEASGSPTVGPSLAEVTLEEAAGEKEASAAASSGEVLFRHPDREVPSPTDSETWGPWCRLRQPQLPLEIRMFRGLLRWTPRSHHPFRDNG